MAFSPFRVMAGEPSPSFMCPLIRPCFSCVNFFFKKSEKKSEGQKPARLLVYENIGEKCACGLSQFALIPAYNPEMRRGADARFMLAQRLLCDAKPWRRRRQIMWSAWKRLIMPTVIGLCALCPQGCAQSIGLDQLNQSRIV